MLRLYDVSIFLWTEPFQASASLRPFDGLSSWRAVHTSRGQINSLSPMTTTTISALSRSSSSYFAVVQGLKIALGAADNQETNVTIIEGAGNPRNGSRMGVPAHITRPAYAGTNYNLVLEGPDKEPIDTIFMSPSSDTTVKRVYEELTAIGQRRGFTVDTNSGISVGLWAQDAGLVFKDQIGNPSILTSTAIGERFREAKLGLAKLLFHNGSLESNHVLSIGGAFGEGMSHKVADTARVNGWNVRTTPLAIDGGNLLALGDGKGGVVALVGRDSLLVNWMMLRNANAFAKLAVDLVVVGRNYDADLVNEFVNASARMGQPLSKDDAIRMAAEVEVTKKIFYSALNLPREKVVFIKQATFHIDMAISLIGPNKVMVSDLNLSLQAIDASFAALKTRQAQIQSQQSGQGSLQTDKSQQNQGSKISVKEVTQNLTDILALEAFRRQTQISIDAGAQALLDNGAQTLQRAGITVVRAATNFGGIVQSKPPPPLANFANGIAAKDRQGKTYFITNKSASESLNRNFETFMATLGIDVEWTSTGSLLKDGGGLHCITLRMTGNKKPGPTASGGAGAGAVAAGAGANTVADSVQVDALATTPSASAATPTPRNSGSSPSTSSTAKAPTIEARGGRNNRIGPNESGAATGAAVEPEKDASTAGRQFTHIVTPPMRKIQIQVGPDADKNFGRTEPGGKPEQRLIEKDIKLPKIDKHPDVGTDKADKAVPAPLAPKPIDPAHQRRPAGDQFERIDNSVLELGNLNSNLNLSALRLRTAEPPAPQAERPAAATVFDKPAVPTERADRQDAPMQVPRSVAGPFVLPTFDMNLMNGVGQILGTASKSGAAMIKNVGSFTETVLGVNMAGESRSNTPPPSFVRQRGTAGKREDEARNANLSAPPRSPLNFIPIPALGRAAVSGGAVVIEKSVEVTGAVIQTGGKLIQTGGEVIKFLQRL